MMLFIVCGSEKKLVAGIIAVGLHESAQIFTNESWLDMGKKRELTPKMMAFARHVAAGKTYAEAYRQAYDSRGKPSTAQQEGSRLMADPQIAARVQVLIKAREDALVRSAVSDRDAVLSKLRAWLENNTDPNTGLEPSPAQLQAANLLGKTVALYTDKVETSEQKSSDQISAEIEQRLAQLLDNKQDDTVGESIH